MSHARRTRNPPKPPSPTPYGAVITTKSGAATPKTPDLWHNKNGLIINSAALRERMACFEIGPVKLEGLENA